MNEIEIDKFRKELGEQFADIRSLKGITQADLSEMSGVSDRTIRGVEQGAFSARIDVLQKMANALDCDMKIVQNFMYLFKT